VYQLQSALIQYLSRLFGLAMPAVEEQAQRTIEDEATDYDEA
jgi:hypothetical protein